MHDATNAKSALDVGSIQGENTGLTSTHGFGHFFMVDFHLMNTEDMFEDLNQNSTVRHEFL